MNTLTIPLKFRAMIALITAGSLLSFASAASAAKLKVTVTNLAPSNGLQFTPLWVGFHNGTFDNFNFGQSINASFERLIEDGNNDPLTTLFNGAGAGTVQGSLFGTAGAVPVPFESGETKSMFFEVDPTLASSRYFSYASMVIPSNDGFFANDDPLEHRIFDANGRFIGADFIILGSEILDAGSEVNTESFADTPPPFFGQQIPNTGTPENGVVHTHLGLTPGGNILSDPRFANANFLAPGYQVARIQVQLVPEPSTVFGLLALGGAFAIKGRKKIK